MAASFTSALLFVGFGAIFTAIASLLQGCNIPIIGRREKFCKISDAYPMIQVNGRSGLSQEQLSKAGVELCARYEPANSDTYGGGTCNKLDEVFPDGELPDALQEDDHQPVLLLKCPGTSGDEKGEGLQRVTCSTDIYFEKPDGPIRREPMLHINGERLSENCLSDKTGWELPTDLIKAEDADDEQHEQGSADSDSRRDGKRQKRNRREETIVIADQIKSSSGRSSDRDRRNDPRADKGPQDDRGSDRSSDSSDRDSDRGSSSGSSDRDSDRGRDRDSDRGGSSGSSDRDSDRGRNRDSDRGGDSSSGSDGSSAGDSNPYESPFTNSDGADADAATTGGSDRDGRSSSDESSRSPASSPSPEPYEPYWVYEDRRRRTPGSQYIQESALQTPSQDVLVEDRAVPQDADADDATLTLESAPQRSSAKLVADHAATYQSNAAAPRHHEPHIVRRESINDAPRSSMRDVASAVSKKGASIELKATLPSLPVHHADAPRHVAAAAHASGRELPSLTSVPLAEPHFRVALSANASSS